MWTEEHTDNVLIALLVVAVIGLVGVVFWILA